MRPVGLLVTLSRTAASCNGADKGHSQRQHSCLTHSGHLAHGSSLGQSATLAHSSSRSWAHTGSLLQGLLQQLVGPGSQQSNSTHHSQQQQQYKEEQQQHG